MGSFRMARSVPESSNFGSRFAPAWSSARPGGHREFQKHKGVVETDVCVTDSLKQGVPSKAPANSMLTVEDILPTTETCPVQPFSARGRGVKKQTVLTPEMRSFIDRAIVPALVREYLARERKVNPVAPISPSVDNGARTSPSAEESTL
jgi:hypothetical protein